MWNRKEAQGDFSLYAEMQQNAFYAPPSSYCLSAWLRIEDLKRSQKRGHKPVAHLGKE